MDHLIEKNIKIGDEFIFTDPKYGDGSVYRIVAHNNDPKYYFYTKIGIYFDIVDVDFDVLATSNDVRSFHENSLYAESCQKFNREKLINELLE